MPTSTDDLAAVDAQIDQLKNELARLDSAFAQNLKALGVAEGDLKNVDFDSQPEEIKKLLAEAKKAAARAGSDRANAAKGQAAPSTPPPSRRGGAVSV